MNAFLSFQCFNGLQAGAPWAQAVQAMNELSARGFDAPVNDAPEAGDGDEFPITLTQALRVGEDEVAVAYFSRDGQGVLSSCGLAIEGAAVPRPEDLETIVQGQLRELAQVFPCALADLNQTRHWDGDGRPDGAVIYTAVWTRAQGAGAGTGLNPPSALTRHCRDERQLRQCIDQAVANERQDPQGDAVMTVTALVSQDLARPGRWTLQWMLRL